MAEPQPFLNGWGETLININDRTFPNHPHGRFAICLKGATVALPANTQRVDLPARGSRVLTRVKLGSDWKWAEALQHAFTMQPTATPRLPKLPQTPVFDLQKLPGVEAFEVAETAMEAEPDINPGMEGMQEKVHAIARAINDPEERARVDAAIRQRAFADFAKAVRTKGPSTLRNGWTRAAVTGEYGSDYLTRTLYDYGEIWANTPNEAKYFRAAMAVHTP